MLSVCFSCASATGTTFISLVPLGSLYNAIPYTSFHFFLQSLYSYVFSQAFCRCRPNLLKIFIFPLFFAFVHTFTLGSSMNFVSQLFFLDIVCQLYYWYASTNLSLSNECCINGVLMMGTLAHLKSLYLRITKDWFYDTGNTGCAIILPRSGCSLCSNWCTSWWLFRAALYSQDTCVALRISSVLHNKNAMLHGCSVIICCSVK